MSEHDLQARPIYSRKRDSIESPPHSRSCSPPWPRPDGSRPRTGWSIKKFVRTARRYRTIQIQAGTQTIIAADPLPDDLNQLLRSIHDDLGASH